MPKAQKGGGIDKYPGLKVFATKVFREVPAEKHDALRALLHHFVTKAKATGEATQIDWASQSMASLKARFGIPAGSVYSELTREVKSAGTPELARPSAVSKGKKNEVAATLASRTQSNAQNNNMKAMSATTGSSASNQTTEERFRAAHIANGAHKSGANIGTSHNGMRSLSSVNSKGLRGSVNDSVGARGSVKKEARKSKSNSAASIAELRRARFDSPSANESPYMELHTGPIRGTCQNLEKPYFRLTGQVNSSVVRPPEVLERALDHVYGNYEKNRANYDYIAEQFKSLRQDLTVQHIVSPLSVRIYEYNARVAIEHEKLDEYNQCATQLQDLYARATELTDKQAAEQMLQNRKEFQSYAIYYKIYVGAWQELGVLLQQLNAENVEWKSELRGSALMLKRAMNCVAIVAANRNLALFECWREATPLEGKLIGKFAQRQRLRWLEAIARATSQQNQVLPLEFVGRGLGFTHVEEVCAFLDELKVPRIDTHMRSTEALPAIIEAAARPL